MNPTFEKWAKKQEMNLERVRDTYRSGETAYAWDAWEAALVHAVAICGEVEKYWREEWAALDALSEVADRAIESMERRNA